MRSFVTPPKLCLLRKRRGGGATYFGDSQVCTVSNSLISFEAATYLGQRAIHIATARTGARQGGHCTRRLSTLHLLPSHTYARPHMHVSARSAAVTRPPHETTHTKSARLRGRVPCAVFLLAIAAAAMPLVMRPDGSLYVVDAQGVVTYDPVAPMSVVAGGASTHTCGAEDTKPSVSGGAGRKCRAGRLSLVEVTVVERTPCRENSFARSHCWYK